MVYKFFNQSYKEIVPPQIQLIVLSLILQGLIETKDILDKTKKGLTNAIANPDSKDFSGLVKAKDLKTLNINVLANKDKLMAFMNQ